MVWLDGALVPEHEARISPFDHGLTTGDGCFETLVTYWRMPFAFTRHYERLVRSAEGMGMKGIPSKEALLEAVKAVVGQNGFVDPVRIRMTITGGLSGLGLSRSGERCTSLVCAVPAPVFDESAKVWTVSGRRNERSAVAGLKTISCAEDVAALLEAQAQGADEALFANTKGDVCEGAGSNIFWVRDGVVHTPSLECGALAGITRGLVMELCGELGMKVAEVEEPMNVLDTADEVFLTSTAREVQPVAILNGRRLFAGATTLRLRKAYKDMVEDDLDP